MPRPARAQTGHCGADGATSAELSFVLLADDFEQPDALAEALIAKGCSVQLEALGSTLEASPEAAS